MVALRQMKDNDAIKTPPNIFNAALNDDVSEMFAALNDGQKLDDKDEIGNFTPIHVAIIRESANFLKYAMDYDFNPWIRDLNDRLAFDHASALGMKDIQKRLYRKMYPSGWHLQNPVTRLEP